MFSSLPRPQNKGQQKQKLNSQSNTQKLKLNSQSNKHKLPKPMPKQPPSKASNFDDKLLSLN